MQPIPSLHSCAERRSDRGGFTLVELLVSMLLGLMVTGMCMSSALVNREVIKKDTMRTRINENVRSAMDIIGADLRIAGENLSSTFPAIELQNGAGTAPDTLILRRNLIAEVLPLCTAIAQGSSVTQIYFAIPGSVAGCVYSGQTHNYNVWKNYRLADADHVLDAYIYDSAAKVGEFFKYSVEGDTGTRYFIQRSPGTWAHAYQTASSAVYLLEEWKYSLSNGTMTLVQNGDSANPYNVAFDAADFQVNVRMQDGAVKTAFTPSDAWTSIQSIEMNLTGSDSFRGSVMNRTLSSRYFPRNVLSH